MRYGNIFLGLGWRKIYRNWKHYVKTQSYNLQPVCFVVFLNTNRMEKLIDFNVDVSGGCERVDFQTNIGYQ